MRQAAWDSMGQNETCFREVRGCHTAILFLFGAPQSTRVGKCLNAACRPVVDVCVCFLDATGF